MSRTMKLREWRNNKSVFPYWNAGGLKCVAEIHEENNIPFAFQREVQGAPFWPGCFVHAKGWNVWHASLPEEPPNADILLLLVLNASVVSSAWHLSSTNNNGEFLPAFHPVLSFQTLHICSFNSPTSRAEIFLHIWMNNSQVAQFLVTQLATSVCQATTAFLISLDPFFLNISTFSPCAFLVPRLKWKVPIFECATVPLSACMSILGSFCVFQSQFLSYFPLACVSVPIPVLLKIK